MSIVSFGFYILVFGGTILYYCIPPKIQWVELLGLSLIFYFFAAEPYTIIYLVISTLVAYFATITIEKQRNLSNSKSSVTAIITAVAILVNIGLWFILKGGALWQPVVEKYISHGFWTERLATYGTRMVAALGMGYYTLQIIGYIIDCYWANIKPQKNPLKLFLFVAYFPQLTTGPISRYSQLEDIFTGHSFEFRNIKFGAQRILWGLIKKLVWAERIGVIISGINNDFTTYHGFYSWIMILLYPLQMYADFSGCMDIILGVSELFGIKLQENFNNPFFSRTSQEFWQRWHISLGAWAKDYVLYPLLKLKMIVNFGKYARKKFGRKAGKFLVNLIGMFILWMVMGIWHGGWRYIVGVSLWYWLILMMGELFSPVFKKIQVCLKIKTDNFSWHLFQSGRTYLIYAIGATFFCCGIHRAIELFKDVLRVIFVKSYANPWIFFDQSILNLNVTYVDLNHIIVGIVMMLVVAVLREKYGYARIWIEEQGVVFRWLLWIGLFIYILIWGKYGPGFSASEFIYQGF